MFKTNKRVISLILAAMMVLSMVSVFAFAEDTVAAFADSYATMYRETYGKEAVIDNKAIFVDAAITDEQESSAEVISTTWDEMNFTFTAGVNAFNTVKEAYQQAVVNATDDSYYNCPDILIGSLNSSDATLFVIWTSSNVYTRAWDTAPMNEMGDSFNALTSNGADWTTNTQYASKTCSVKNLCYSQHIPAGSTASAYGFTVTNVISWGDFNNAATGTGVIRTPDINNPTTTRFVNGYFKSANSIFFYKYCNGAANNDVIEVKNVCFDSTSVNPFYSNQGDQRIAAKTTLDGIYLNVDNITSTSNNQILAPRVDNSKVVIKNSNIRGSHVGNLYININNSAASVDVEYKNNIIWTADNDKVDLLRPYFNAIKSGSFTLDGNFIYAGQRKRTTLISTYGNAKASVNYVIKNNKFVALNGTSGNISLLISDVGAGKVVAENNYITRAKNADITYSNVGDGSALNTFYADKTGLSLTEASSSTAAYVNSNTPYYYDYAMTKNSIAFPLVAGDVSIGGVGATINNEDSTIVIEGSDVEIAPSDFVNYTEYNNKIKEVTHKVVDGEEVETGYALVKPTVKITNLSGATVSKIDTSVAGKYNVTVAYEGYVTKTYAVTVGEYEVTAFAETYESKYQTKYGKAPVIKNDAVLVDSTINATEQSAESFARAWDGVEFTFQYGVNAFATLADAFANLGENKQVVVLNLDSASVTNFTIKNNAKVYSPAWDEAPMVEMEDDNWKAKDSNGADWTRNEDYFDKTITVKSILFDNTVTSSASIYGFSLQKAFRFDASITDDFRAPNLDAPVTINVENTYVAPADGNYIDEVFYYTYGASNGTASVSSSNKATYDNKDVLNIKNMWVDRTEFAYNGRCVFPAYTTFDGLYVDLNKRVLNTNTTFLTAADDSTITIKRSNLRGQVPEGKHFYLSSSKDYNTTRVATLENNILWLNSTNANPNTNLSILTPNMNAMTKLEVKDNFINRQGAANNVLLPYYGNLAPVYNYTIHITGNKILGLGKNEHLLNSATKDGSTFIADNYIAPTKQTSITPTTENCAELIAAAYKDEAGFSPLETQTSSAKFNGESKNTCYYDYAMTKHSGALTLQTDDVFTVESGVVKVAKDAVVTADSIKANAMLDAPEGSAQPIVKIKNIDGVVVDSIDTSAATLYTITLSFDGVASNKYTLNVDNFVANDFNAGAEDGGYVDETETITNTAILLDSSLEGEAIDSAVVRKWGDAYYTFYVGSTAFAAYANAEAAATAEGASGQIIVTGWNGTAITVSKSVEIYSPNWNTVPMLEMADGFDALASNGADWTPNTENWKTGFELASLSTSVTNINVGVYGFEYNGVIAPVEKSTTGTITIKNSIFESETADILNPKFTVDNTATLNVVNMYVKDAVNLFTNNHFPANTTFEGLYFDVTKISRNNYAQTYASGASTITFKDSYIYGTANATKSYRLIASHANQKNLTAGTRVATYHNNTLKFKQAYGMLYTETHDTSSMVVTNNYMDKTVDGGAELIYSPVRIGSRLTGGQETSLVFENNKVVGYGKAFYSAITTDFTPKNNFVTSATAANAASATGVKLHRLRARQAHIGLTTL